MYYKKYCVVFLEEKVDFIGVNLYAITEYELPLLSK